MIRRSASVCCCVPNRHAVLGRFARCAGNSLIVTGPKAIPLTRRAAAAHESMLTDDQVRTFNEEGFLVIPDFATKEECQTLKSRANTLVDSYDPLEKSVFSTIRQEATSNTYFLDSSDRISFFLEEGALDTASGELTVPKERAINKIGHALHDEDTVFASWSRSPRVTALYRALGFVRPLPVQSMYIFKQPSIGGRVVPHQDSKGVAYSAFLATDPPSCIGIWLAVEDATLENGCLHVARRSHTAGVAARLTRRHGDNVGEGIGVEWREGPPDFGGLQLEPLETPAGTLVVLHGANVHGSSANTSQHSRHAYSMHVVEGAPGYTWLPDNWLQRSAEKPFVPLGE